MLLSIASWRHARTFSRLCFSFAFIFSILLGGVSCAAAIDTLPSASRLASAIFKQRRGSIILFSPFLIDILQTSSGAERTIAIGGVRGKRRAPFLRASAASAD